MFASFRRSVELARHYPDLYFVGLLTLNDTRSAFGAATVLGRSWIYNPLVTITVFLTQCLSPDHSCREAVSRLIAWRVRNQMKPCSADTGAYCIARDQLTEKQCQDLARQTGKQLEDSAPKAWLWLGRRVRIIDGSTVSMPDTEANQAEYSQQKQQKPGCGFPIARILVVFSLSVGSVVELLIGPYKGKMTGENTMLRTIHDQFAKGDVALVDRLFAGWFDIALRLQQGIKNILQMDHLRCKTPERIRKEFYMHMLAYNLIRKVMAIAAKEASVAPYQISFKGALQTLNNFLQSFNRQTDIEQWCRALINAIGSHRVADRPDRYEPRVRKRRPKPYPLMTKPRNDYKKSIQ